MANLMPMAGAGSHSVRRAIQDGATDITVVLTHNPDFRLKPIPRWMGRLAYPEWPMVAGSGPRGKM